MNRHRYQDDVMAWADEQAGMLRAGETAGLDFENLAEEIEGLGASQRIELRSRLIVLVHHLLKFRFQPERRSTSWRGSIREQRDRLELLLEDSPSLRRLLPSSLARIYPVARRKALDEMGLDRLPEDCPFTLDQVLDPQWLPD